MIYRNIKSDLTKMLAKDLQGVQTVGLTTDIWTSRNQNDFLAVTLHYITKGYVAKTILLECTPFLAQHKAEQIRNTLEEVIASYTCLKDKDIWCTTDGASNMGAAIKSSTVISQRLVCVDHTLNNCIKTSLESTPIVKGVIEECKRLVKRLHHSALDTRILESACLFSEGKNNYNQLRCCE